MFRQTTYVTSSPLRSARRASAAATSRSTSGPRAESSAVASSSVGSDASSARENAAETPPQRGRDHEAGGPSEVPMNHSSAGRARPSPSAAAFTDGSVASSSQVAASRRYLG